MRTLLIAASILLVIYLALVVTLILSGRRYAATELVALLPNLVLLFRDLAKAPRVPRGPKIALAAAALWLVSPIDLIPGFIPLLGPLDDVVVAALALRYLTGRAGVEVVPEPRPRPPP